MTSFRKLLVASAIVAFSTVTAVSADARSNNHGVGRGDVKGHQGEANGQRSNVAQHSVDASAPSSRLPPGLAKQDPLPHGLEKRESLPRGLERDRREPRGLARRPELPPGLAH
jgi:hypothetical protein